MATALFYGDAVITPAISILSAVEGVTLADAKFAVAVLPVTVADHLRSVCRSSIVAPAWSAAFSAR